MSVPRRGDTGIPAGASLRSRAGLRVTARSILVVLLPNRRAVAFDFQDASALLVVMTIVPPMEGGTAGAEWIFRCGHVLFRRVPALRITGGIVGCYTRVCGCHANKTIESG